MQAAAPDLAEKGRSIDRQRYRRRRPGIDLDADERQAEEEDEELAEKRRALDEIDIENGEPIQGPERHDTQHRHEETENTAAHRGDERQKQRPARGEQQIDDIGRSEFADHRAGLLTKTAQ